MSTSTYGSGFTINGTFAGVSAGDRTVTLTDIMLNSNGPSSGGDFGTPAGFDAYYNAGQTTAANVVAGVDWPLSEVVPGAPEPELTLTKVADTPNFEVAGDEIDYTFTVENTGDVDVTALVIDDALLDDPAVCVSTALATTESTTCTGTHTVTAGEVTAEEVVNTATASADAEGSPVESNEDSATVAIVTPQLTLEKTADVATFLEGDTINYNLTLTNSGNTMIEGPFTVDDDLTTDEACPGAPTDLNPGDDIVCTATYTATAADVTATEIVNIATGSAANGGNAVDTAQDSVTVTLAEPGLSLTKNATASSFSGSGQTIDYILTLENTGNVDLAAPFAIQDDLTADEACPALPATLAPTESIECSASYATTEGDVTAGAVTNTATGTADYNGSPVTSNESSVTVDFSEEAPAQDIPSRVTEQISDIICQNTLLAPGPWTGAGQGGGTAPAATEDPTFTLDLSPAVPDPGAPVAITVVFSEGIANGPTTITATFGPLR